jgi:hypothetical protein
MKTSILHQLIAVPALLGALALLHACSSASGSQGNAAAAAGAAVAAPLNRTVTLTAGQGVLVPAVAAGTNAAAPATLRLERVNDSRCRKNTVCVWAGYISYSFSLTNADGTVSNFVLSDNMPNTTSKVTQSGLTFTLAGVEPQAVPAKNEPVPDYRVSLRVSNTE